MNFLDRYVKFASPLTESPRTFHYYMAWVVLSMAVQRSVYYLGAGSFPLSPNLWMILLGPSSLSKKSTTLRIAKDHILRPAFGDKKFIYPAEGSHEALIERMSVQPQGLVSHAEFANLMSWLHKDYNAGMMGVLTDLYDQPLEYERRVGTRDKAKTYTINNSFVNIATCSTIDWLNKNLKEQEIMGGFLPRFIIVMDRSNSELVPITPPIDTTLQTDLVNELQMMMNRPRMQLDYTEPASKNYCDWYREFMTRRVRKANPLAHAFHSRRMSDFHKFAMLNCVMRDGTRMDNTDLDMAAGITEQLCEYVEELVSNKLALNLYQANRGKIMEIIEGRSNTNGGAPHSTVLKLSRLSGRDFNEIIQTLLEERSILKKEELAVSGRKQVFYKISAEEPDES